MQFQDGIKLNAPDCPDARGGGISGMAPGLPPHRGTIQDLGQGDYHIRGDSDDNLCPLRISARNWVPRTGQKVAWWSLTTLIASDLYNPDSVKRGCGHSHEGPEGTISLLPILLHQDHLRVPQVGTTSPPRRHGDIRGEVGSRGEETSG